MTDETSIAAFVNRMAWLKYEQDWRDFKTGLTASPPRPPLQLGRHIDTLPREMNAAVDPHRLPAERARKLA